MLLADFKLNLERLTVELRHIAQALVESAQIGRVQGSTAPVAS